MSWQELRLKLPARELPRIEALLRLAGAQSFAVCDAADEPLLEPPVGETPLWPRVELRALFAADVDLTGIASLIGTHPGGPKDSPEIAIVADADWLRAWREIILPFAVAGRLEIVPASDAEAPVSGRLALHMGLAFGTGQHPTTRLCLQWIAARLVPGATVLDYGCGSGILALAALRLGAGRAFATDDDPQALTSTRDNATLNRLEAALWVGQPAELPPLEADVVLANILAGPLCKLAPSFALKQPEFGRVVLSGLLVDQLDRVQEAYAPYYDSFETEQLDGWCRLTGRRNARTAEAVGGR